MYIWGFLLYFQYGEGGNHGIYIIELGVNMIFDQKALSIEILG